jgi:SAM-dependent methyltransferase
MDDKPKQFSAEYASIFQDASVVAAYRHRPAYPPETFEVLLRLLPPAAARRTVLDAGCGTGFVARPLAPRVDRVDAVDISPAMIRTGRGLPGGDHANLRWQIAPVETAALHGPYALIVAAASLHWMDWGRTLPRFAAHLAPGGVLAVVSEVAQPNPWDAAVEPILGRYSMNRDYAPYTSVTVVAELERRGLFRLLGRHETAPVPFRQTVDGWVESFHARNGLSRDRMDAAAARACDAELRAAIAPYCPEQNVQQQIAARILWGTPVSAAANAHLER